MSSMRTIRVVHGEEIRHHADGDVGHIEGYAVKFNRFSQNLGGFVEQIAPGSAVRTIKEKALSSVSDIRGTYNHRQILARQSTGTLSVAEDAVGIRYKIDLNLALAAHREVMEMVKTRLVTGSSFGFRSSPGRETWSETDVGFPLVTINELELFDVGPVDFPAYLDSEAESRDLVRLRSFLASHNQPPEYAELQLRDGADPNNFNSFLDEIRSQAADGDPVVATPRLNIARRRMGLATWGRLQPPQPERKILKSLKG